jgi:hypothetical protein
MGCYAAVLSGDLIGSASMSSHEGRPVAEILKAAVEEAVGAFPSVRLSPLDVFRGDSWQLMVEPANEALRVSLFIRAHLRGHGPTRIPYWDTRIAIGLGSVDHVVSDQISESQGEAFVVSGRGLDGLADERNRTMVLCPANRDVRPAEAAVISLLDALVRGWSDKQALAVAGRLRGWTQEAIAESFTPPVKQHTAGAHLLKANWEAIEDALFWFSETFQSS